MNRKAANLRSASQSTLTTACSDDTSDSRSEETSSGDEAAATKVVGASPQKIEHNVDPALWHIHGNSYDLSGFVNKHPGGRLAILSGRGRDCTALFESYHPWNDKHRKVLKAYGAEPPPPDPFYEELKAGVRRIFPGGCGSTKMRLRAKVGLSVAWLTMIWLFFIVRTPVSCTLAGALMATIGTRLSHEGGHFQVSKHEWVNRMAQFCGYFLTGPSMAWLYRHTISHHAHTNQEADVDVEYIWIADKMPKWLKIMMLPFMGVGAPIELGIKYLFVDYLAKRSVGGNVIVDRTMGHAIPEIIVWCTVHWFLGPSWLCYVLMLWATGTIFVPLSQVAHVIVFPDHKKYDSWAKMQIAESVDFATDSDFWFHLAFGLTTQVEHHLFPGLGHHCYNDCREVVMEVCKKHGVPYYHLSAKKALGLLWRRWVDGQAVPIA